MLVDVKKGAPTSLFDAMRAAHLSQRGAGGAPESKKSPTTHSILANGTKLRDTFTMNTAPEIQSHIAIDSVGRAWIDDSNVKVIEIARDHIAYGWSPEEIHWQYPHLSLAQIYASLTYYHDNRVAMDAEIKASLEAANTAARIPEDSPIARRLQGLSR